jgi:hypothetical protein
MLVVFAPAWLEMLGLVVTCHFCVLKERTCVIIEGYHVSK